MNPPLDNYSSNYHRLQGQRVEITRRRIEAINRTVAPGWLVPAPADLPIGRGRRLEAAILFLDISGFTLRASETTEEQDGQVRILSLFFSEMIRIVGDLGGTVEKNTGDGIMAYFGRPRGTASDPRQSALVCSLYMFLAAERLINPVIQATNLEPLRFRICLDFGAITVARLGAAQRFNHIVAVGTAANRTSKMLAHAEPGDLLLGDAMLPGIRADWREQFLAHTGKDSGWVYNDGEPYHFWRYNGRWNPPWR
ncbi:MULTISPECIES: adenylate/guanylate cyclase domain-containing protein [Sphingomonas]|uniref:adenylate/guanylate cyclase domain-containing protein n=1 Tax=Sphingomonas TaxID=13687 RepID=UPI0008323E38|nr:adenylate/guanylate cyclase domain-containing protein [Sphingomonas sp. CCH10-B3]